MKQFDKIFRKHAEKAFSSYNADQMADEGWNEFVIRRKGKKRFAVIITFWAKAASVALLVSVGGLFMYQTLRDRPESYSTKAELVSNPLIEPEIPFVSDKVSLKPHPSSGEEVDGGLTVKLSAAEKTMDEAVVMKDTGVTDEIKFSQLDSDKLVNETVKNEKLAENNLADDGAKDVSVTGLTDGTPIGRKTSIIAGFSGMMSSIEDMMVNSPGVSVGFYLEHKITKKLSIRPGLALAKNSYSSTSFSAGEVFMKTTASYASMTGSVDSYENQLDMISMEVPVNMVYTILERGKSSLFVSAGVSTMIYLDQSFSSSFTNVLREQKYDIATGDVYYETISQNVIVEGNEKAFSHVDYFGLTNLSAGYSLPLRKGGNLLIEPFLQLPVSDLSSFNVRIRYGGLSLKFRFGQESPPAK